jgi:hypothetical protein
MTTYHEYNTSEPFEKFVSEAIGCENLSEENLKDILNPDFDNVLFCSKSSKNIKGYEIDIKRLSENYYAINKTKVPKKIDIRFGCEFETCFILNCRENSEKLKELFEWEELVYYHIKYNIVPYLSEEFLKLFRYAIILNGYHNEQGTYIDLKNGNIVGNLKEENYRTLIFEPDGSIKCDKVDDQITVSCEIVTPILKSIEELRILYEGVIPQNVKCNQSNKSMGFHVNVSAVDDKGEIIKLSNGMLTELIYEWLPYERKHYKTYRGEGSRYAQKIFDYLNDSTYLVNQNTNILSIYDEKIQDYDVFQKYGLGVKQIVNLINSEKYLSMTHHKNNNVIEFRIFNSNTDINELLNYTQDSIAVFDKAIQKYCNHPENTLVPIQMQNMLYKFTTSFEIFERLSDPDFYELIYHKIVENGGECQAFIYTPKNFGFFGKTYGKTQYHFYWRSYDYINKPGIKQFLVGFKKPNTLSSEYYIYDIVKTKEEYIMSNPSKISNLEAQEIIKMISY